MKVLINKCTYTGGYEQLIGEVIQVKPSVFFPSDYTQLNTGIPILKSDCTIVEE